MSSNAQEQPIKEGEQPLDMLVAETLDAPIAAPERPDNNKKRRKSPITRFNALFSRFGVFWSVDKLCEICAREVEKKCIFGSYYSKV